jgi:hypothetical protein
MRKASRVMTWVCVLAIAVLSLLPADAMVRTGFDGRVEHFVAYAGTMLIAGFGYGMQRGGCLRWRRYVRTPACWRSSKISHQAGTHRSSTLRQAVRGYLRVACFQC